MSEKTEKPKRKGPLAYLAVLLAGLLLVGAAYRFIPEKKPDPQPVPTKTERESASAGSTAPAGSTEPSDRQPSASEEAPSASGTTDSEAPSESGNAPVPTQTVETLPPIEIETYVEGEVVDSYYQYVNDYNWQDLYTLMILIGQTGIGLNEGSEGKHSSFSIFSFNPEFDPMIFVGFTDPATNISVMTLYITDSGYVYELLKVFNDRIYIDPENGSICTAGGSAYYRYSPHVLKKMPKSAGEIPAGFIPLPVTDATGIKITRQDVESYLIRYGEGGQ